MRKKTGKKQELSHSNTRGSLYNKINFFFPLISVVLVAVLFLHDNEVFQTENWSISIQFQITFVCVDYVLSIL